MTPRSVSTLAPAKINLFLRILHPRGDGFREVETVFQSVSLADRVRVTVSDEAVAEQGTVRLRVTGADVGPERENLAWRAAERFVARCAPALTVSVELEKRIPAGAGLGGGSSDAGAVLRCLAETTGFEDRAVLHGIAAELGSDVPFFLEPAGIALGRGRGERLEALEPLPPRAVVLALPPVHVSTVEAYRALGAARTVGAVERDPHGGPRELPATKLQSWSTLDTLVENDFEEIVAGRHPEVRASLDALATAGATVRLLSGSGAACFGLFESTGQAEEAATRLTESCGWPFVCCSTLESAPPVVLEDEG